MNMYRLATVSPDIEGRLDVATLSSAPYKVYRRLRDEAPVVWSDRLGSWLVSRYDDVRDVLENFEVFSSAERWTRATTPEPLWEAFAGFEGFFWSDPPAYTHHRQIWTQAFKPRLKGIPSVARGIVDELLDSVDGADIVDVVPAFCFPLPATVIFDLLGVPRGDRDMFRRISGALIAGGAEAAPAMDEAATWLRAFLSKRKERPTDDILSDLAGRLPPIETLDLMALRMEIVNIVQFLLAGHETTTSTLASGLYALLTRPRDRKAFLADRKVRTSAVQEMFRFESPLQFVERRVASPTSLAGVAMAEGDMVKLLLGSANHDEREFDDPERFNIYRTPNPHLAFGRGIHLCLGAPLARIEVPIALDTFLRRFPHAQLACDPSEVVWRENLLFHAIERLSVTLRG